MIFNGLWVSQPIRILFFFYTSESACHKLKKKKKSFHELIIAQRNF